MLINTTKKEIVAMLLAGGQGSRLGVLTDNVAKPAVPFGGKYRIIDFPLSNCTNSGIYTVGVLTQYRPLELNAYIGSGQPWDLDRLYGGVSILPPYVKGKSGEWYKGTANAIYQNMNFIEIYDPEYVIILSGDHVYKMNYLDMLVYHKEKQADCTIAVISVPIAEASRFGVMNVDENYQVYEFEEKPPEPKSTLASMGVYIFNWKKLKKYLILDEEDPKSQNDFGKNVIPQMLNSGESLYAYEFKGYWKDVGTIESLWEANMDIINPNVPLELNDPPWKIYSKTGLLPPQYVGSDAILRNAYISEGCTINGEINNSIIFPGVVIKRGAVVSNSVIMSNTVIEEDAVVNYSVIATEVSIHDKAIVGGEENDSEGNPKITVMGDGISISSSQKIPAGEMVSRDI